ncbi:protein phosphatase 2C domain-containing protein [Streptomyces sp. NBC_00272]|uniref:protein phosphatase 2C domain-containing protein n=1 Tax=Streptomyces sp. NBC_00272 TaxID=2975698 RepID=UPI002E28ABF3|nr:protein phosphatase 2C domain-containing protein [Streptomyces sp. NBC_00272]
MSQRGADDWWQKLYEDPDAEPVSDPVPDPGDTLESRFHSASSVTALPDTVPPPRPPAPPPPTAPPEPPPHAVVPGPRREADPQPPPPWDPPAPRDPREPGTTGYGLGSVTVPPALPEEPPELPSWRWGVPDNVPPERGADAWPGTGAGVAPGAGTWPDPGSGGGAGLRDGVPDGAGADGTCAPGEATGPGTAPGAPPGTPTVAGGGAGEWPDTGFGAGTAAPAGTWPVPGGGIPDGAGTEGGAAPTSARPAVGAGGPSEASVEDAADVAGRSGVARPGSRPESGQGSGPGFGPGADAGVEPPPGPDSWPGFGVRALDVDAQLGTGRAAGAGEQARPGAGAGGADGGAQFGTGVPEEAAQGGPGERPLVGYLGNRAPTYAAEPGALPVADPGALDGLVPDTVLEGARHGGYTLRATSVRGDSARFRGEARRDFLLTARFGTGDDALVLVALAGGDRAAPGAAEAAAELCRWIASAVGRSRERLADDLRAGRRDALRSGLQRLTDRGYGRLRAHAAELGLAEDAYTAGLRVLLLPIDPECKTRVCFGAGAGGLFRLRAGAWQDLEPEPAPDPAETGGDGFRFRAAVARPRDTLLLCSGGLADPMREEALLPAELAVRWADAEPPGLAAFLADTQLRLKGYADDRTAAAVWEA